MPASHVVQPHRVRKIEKSFAWIDHRLIRNGYLAAMTCPSTAILPGPSVGWRDGAARLPNTAGLLRS